MTTGSSDNNENPAAHIERVYSDTFFLGLTNSAGHNIDVSKFRNELRTIGRLYLILRAREDCAASNRKLRKNYLRLAEQTAGFLDVVRGATFDDIAFCLYMTALRQSEPIPATIFEGLSVHAQTKSGEPYLLELIRLLELLKNAAQEQADYFRERPGPKINSGLELLVRRVADIFAEIDQSFSIDHHKPVPTGPAVDFVKYLLAPLDKISDTEIATAIRTEQARRRKLKLRRSDATPKDRRKSQRRTS